MLSRRSVVALVSIGAVLAILGLLAFRVVLPRAVRAKAEATARARGLELTVRDVHVGFTTVELEGVTLRDPDGVLGGSLDRVALEGSLFSLRHGLRGARRVAVGPGEIIVRLQEPGLSQLLHRMRRSSGDARAAASRTTPISLVGLTLTAVDGDGPLGSVTLDQLDRRGETILLRAGFARLGHAPADELTARGLEIELVRVERLVLRSLRASSVDVHWATRFGSTEEARRGRLVTRLSDSVARVRAALRGVVPDDPETETGDAPSWARRLAADAAIEIGSLALTGPAVSGADERLAFDDLSLTLAPGYEIRARGAGRGARAGSTEWDFRVRPSALRAEGHVRVGEVPLSLLTPLFPSVPWHPAQGGKVSADLELRTEGLAAIELRGSVEVQSAALSSARLSSGPITGISFRASGEGRFHPDERQLDLRSATIAMGDAAVTWAGTLQWSDARYRVVGRLAMPPTPCDAAVHAIPADVLGPLASVQLDGTLSGSLDVRVDSTQLGRTILDFAVQDGCRFVTVPPEADLMRFEGPFQHEALEPDGSVFSMETGPGTPNWTSIFGVSPILPEAVMAHEDGAFYQHSGFAPWAIRDALVRNLERGRYVVGASTITMQLAKNLFLRREKTLVRKIQEVVLAWWLEKSLTKERILELYLNVIEFGPSVYGIRNAARYYFGVTPAELSPVEAAFLANILPAPKLFAGMAASGLTASMTGKISRLLQRLVDRGRVAPGVLEYAMAELAVFRFHRNGALPPELGRALDPLAEAPVDPDLPTDSGTELDPYMNPFEAH